MTTPLAERLSRLAREHAASAGGARRSGGIPEEPDGRAGPDGRAATARGGAATPAVAILKDTRVLVVRAGDVVVKAHPEGTDEAALTARLRAALALPGVLLPPLTDRVEHVAGRPVTVWPAGEPVEPSDPAAAPWEAAAGLLARLHAVPAAGLALPPSGGPARVPRAVSRLDALDGAYAGPAAVIREAFRTLPVLSGAGGTGPGAGRPAHGDWHLGQIVRYEGEWVLIDVDDLGAGDPAWDLARPAAWFATGLLDPDLWGRFLTAYLDAGGSAVSRADPWRELDAPARALTVQLAATAVAAAGAEGRPLDEVEQALVSSCGRIAHAAVRP
ncbi:phosphotransferase family protein [Sphaerisporangium perillae]|uniref:phosphotransferase family protein n=1 Tax=Sphaerisporangium perillae TaxID=2935860 RepID=UPI00200E1DDB|nr:phosphotransferase [Sphaerisporangium perillae]